MNDRRKFIKTIGRGIVLAGLAGVSGALLLREKSEDAERCPYDFICNNCRKRKTCQVPGAKKSENTQLISDNERENG